MLGAERNLVCTNPTSKATAEPRRGDPYCVPRALAQRLADDLAYRASSCQSAAERKRLTVLAAASSQISQCLENVGAKL